MADELTPGVKDAQARFDAAPDTVRCGHVLPIPDAPRSGMGPIVIDRPIHPPLVYEQILGFIGVERHGGAMSNESRSVVITGASRGLGLASAAHLYRRGWRVVAAMRSVDTGLDQLRATTGAQQGDPRLIGIRLDLTDPSSIEEAAAAIVRAVGAPHAVVHNAGVSAAGMVEETRAVRPPSPHHGPARVGGDEVRGPLAGTVRRRARPSARRHRTVRAARGGSGCANAVDRQSHSAYHGLASPDPSDAGDSASRTVPAPGGGSGCANAVDRQPYSARRGLASPDPADAASSTIRCREPAATGRPPVA